MWSIFSVTKEDLPQIVEFETETFGVDAFGWDGMQYAFDSNLYFRKLVDTPDLEHILGFIIVNRYTNSEIHYELEMKVDHPEENIAHILDFCIREEYRGHGAGAFLFRKTLEDLKSRGYKFVLLEEQDSNIRARKFYERFGMRVIQKVDKYYRSGDTAWIYWKKL